MSRPTPGITPRHSRACALRAGAACNCRPTFQANVWSARDQRRIRKTFPTLAAARAWRQDSSVALRKRTMRAPTPTTLRQAAEAFLAGARDGSVRNRSGDTYKPSAIRGYEAALTNRILPDLGALKLHDVTRADVQALADRMLAEGKDPSTIRNTLMPLRVIYRRAVGRGEVAVNPTAGLELPAVRGRRERIASPAEALALLVVLREDDRPLWATALYAGLRRGELMALQWEDVDLKDGLIRVERSYDPKEDVSVLPKSAAGLRQVPIAQVLRTHLVEHRLRSGRAAGLVFGRDGEEVFRYTSLRERCRRAWAKAGLAPIGLHEARHTFASLMIAAGVNAKALSTYMGHSSITITLDRYGHLMPGNLDEAAGMLDAYLAQAERAR